MAFYLAIYATADSHRESNQLAGLVVKARALEHLAERELDRIAHQVGVKGFEQTPPFFAGLAECFAAQIVSTDEFLRSNDSHYDLHD